MIISTDMKVAIKTVKKVVFEVSRSEMDHKGFDGVWDEIRRVYPELTHDLLAIDSVPSDEALFFELTPRA